MQRLLMMVMSFVMTVLTFVAQISGDARTTALLAQARAALGGESTLAKVRAISAHGTGSRAMGEMQISGELDLALQLPDKMLRTDSMSPMGDATIVTETGINGETLLRHTATIGGGPNMVIRMPPPPAHGSDAETQALRASRAELTRLALAFLLTPPASMPLEYSYGGEAEAEDGKADVLDVKGPSSFVARLFLDKASHRPLMLTYKGVAPRMVVSTQTQHGRAARSREGGPRLRKTPRPPARPRNSWTSTCSSTTTSRSTACGCPITSRDRSTASRPKSGRSRRSRSTRPSSPTRSRRSDI